MQGGRRKPFVTPVRILSSAGSVSSPLAGGRHNIATLVSTRRSGRRHGAVPADVQGAKYRSRPYVAAARIGRGVEANVSRKRSPRDDSTRTSDHAAIAYRLNPRYAHDVEIISVGIVSARSGPSVHLPLLAFQSGGRLRSRNSSGRRTVRARNVPPCRSRLNVRRGGLSRPAGCACF
jgi:hypothetical protein